VQYPCEWIYDSFVTKTVDRLSWVMQHLHTLAKAIGVEAPPHPGGKNAFS
jgi:hypothetical protein